MILGSNRKRVSFGSPPDAGRRKTSYRWSHCLEADFSSKSLILRGKHRFSFFSILAQSCRKVVGKVGSFWQEVGSLFKRLAFCPGEGFSCQPFKFLKMPAGAYKIAAVGAQVGIGVAGSFFLTVDAVGKPNGPNAPYCITNEMICGDLGRFLRLPVPPGGIVSSTRHAPMYASLNFNLTGVTLPPVNAATCVRLLPELSTGLLLFDILIANSDRHAGNLSVDALAAPPLMNVFDHSHALLGHAAGQGAARLTGMTDRLAVTGGPLTRGNRHFLLDVVDSDKYFPEWIARVTALPDFLIDGVCADAAPFGMVPAESLAVQTFLKHRRNTFLDLIKSHRADFRAIKTWSSI